MEYRELVLQYADSLKTDLTWASKSHITALTMLAGENKAAAASICATIERHIISVSPVAKLPALYLLDSIVKNVKEPYIGLFSRNLSQIFMDIWRHRELHPQLLKLLGMWDGIFPKQLLDRMHQAVKQSSPAQMSGRQNVPPVQYPAQAQPVQQHSGQWRPTSGAPPLQPVAPYATHGASTSSRGPYTAVQQPVYTTRESMPPASVQYVGPSNGYNYAHPGSHGGHPQAAWQQQQPLVQQSHYPPAQVQQSSQPMVLPSLLTSLLSSGLLSVQQPVSFAPALSSAPVVSYTHPPSRAGTPEPVNPEDCKFVPNKLKVLNPTALSSLMGHTAQLRSKHLDMQFMRRRRQKNMTGATRQWFVNADLWLAGTAAAAVGEAGAPTDAQEPEALVEAPSVPVDDAQPRCAISGEKFEVFWHEQHQEWRYKNAVKLEGDDAAQHGLQPGALALASTLSGMPASVDNVLSAEHQTDAAQEVADTARIESEMQDAVSTVQNPASASVTAAGRKRSAELAAAPDSYSQLHVDKRVKLEV